MTFLTIHKQSDWFWPTGRVAVLALAAVGLFFSTGCVQRRMMIRSNPPGAMVYVDDYPIGTTPIAHNFINYGTRKIRLELDGYETLTVYQRMSAPWYEIPPLDFVSENFLPGELRDRRVATYQLLPQRQVPPDELLGRAEDLRARTARPTPVVPPAVGTPGVSGAPGIGGVPTYALPPGTR